jgi:MFS transporter, ACS family, hexuronate transporter
VKQSDMRWAILALLFFGTTINYLDRIVLGVLVPDIRLELKISTEDYGWITAAFQAAYTAGMLFMGGFVDRVGTRMAYAAAALAWSAAAGLTVFARSAIQFAMWRSFLGLAESCNFPAAIKSVSEWFEEKDRAFATGVFNSGTNISAVIGPPILVYLSRTYGWRACFLLTASLGILWVAAWLWIHPRVEKIAAAKSKGMPWAEAARLRGTWGFAAGKFFSDPVWWFYLFWLPLYLHDVRKLDMQTVGWALPFIYVMASVGSVLGGWGSGMLIRNGWEPIRARKIVMFICACCVPFASLGVVVPSAVHAILLFSLATAAHQGWSANLFTTVSDSVPQSAVGAVVGIGGFAGGLSGIIFSAIVPGKVIPKFGYSPVFLGMAVFYFIGLFMLDRLMKKSSHVVEISR